MNLAASLCRRRRALGRRGEPSTFLLWPAASIVAALFIVPLARLVGYSLQQPSGGIGFGAYSGLFGNGNLFLKVVYRTVEISAIVTVVTLMLGYPLAYLAIRVRPMLRTALLVCVVLPFFSSALVRTYAWQVLLANNGPINSVLVKLHLVEHPITLVYNDVGVVIGTSQVLLPMMVFPLYSSMRRIDRSYPRAAQSMGANPLAAWRTTFLPLTAEGIGAGSSIVFLSALGFYVTPVLLEGPSTPLMAQRLGTLINIPGERASVCAQATILLLLVVVVVWLSRRRLGLALAPQTGADTKRKTTSAPGRAFRTVVAAIPDNVVVPTVTGLRAAEGMLSRVRYLLLGLFTLAAVALLLLPIPVIVLEGFSNSSFLHFPPPGYSGRWINAYLHDQKWLDSTWFSVWVCAVSGAAATVAGTLAAFYIARSRRRLLPSVAYVTLILPMVMPQVILAVGLYYLLAPSGLLGDPWALVLAYTIMGLPLGVVILTAIFQGVDRSYEQAAASLGASPQRVARNVLLPLVRPALIGSAIFAFITGFDDLVMAQFLGGYNSETLVRRMFENIQFEVSPEVAAVGTLLTGVLVAGGMAFATARAASRVRRARARRVPMSVLIDHARAGTVVE